MSYPGKWPLILVILGALQSIVLGGCGERSPEVQKATHRARAQEYVAAQKFREAVIEFQNVVQIDPADTDAHYRLGLLYLQLRGESNSEGNAFREFTTVLRLDPDHRDAQFKVAALYLLSNEPGRAREIADKLLAKSATDVDALILRAQAYMAEQRFSRSSEDLKQVLILNPTYIRGYIDLARVYLTMHNQGEAETTLRKALTVDPDSLEVRVSLGDYFMILGQSQNAMSEYTYALNRAPQNEIILSKLAELYRSTGDWDQAEAALQRITEVKPGEVQAHLILGDFYLMMGKFEKALFKYKDALQIDPASRQAKMKVLAHNIDTGNLGEAEKEVAAILGHNKNDPDGIFYEARIELAKGHIAEAESRLRKVLQYRPVFGSAHQFMGILLAKKGEIHLAKQELTEALRQDPTLMEARVMLGSIDLADGRADLAIEQAKQVLSRNPRYVPAAFLIGDAHLKNGQFSLSKQVFRTLADALPNEPRVFHRLGLVAAAEKNQVEAERLFEEALSRDPSFAEALDELVNIKLLHGQLLSASERVKAQIALRPTNARFHHLYGKVATRMSDFVQAESAFQRALEFDKTNVSTYFELAHIYKQGGKTEKAMTQYRLVLEKSPQSLEAHMLLGILLQREQQFDEARRHYEQSLAIDRRFAPAANNLAWLLLENYGNIDAAMGYAQTAREGKPYDPFITDTLGWIYLKKGVTQRARRLLEESAGKLTGNATAQYHYGVALYETGEKLRAKQLITYALKLDPNFPGSDHARKVLEELS
ncbi:MAG: tetratricopeptide repeat protein [Nitrospiraceae bacterium]